MAELHTPIVSIITPTYNASKYIEATIKAIQAQTFQDWELIITDDYSSDNTIQIVEEFVKDDKRIKLFVLSENGGGGIARNNSIKHAVGRYIAFCDSDDCWFPTKLEKQLAFMEEKRCALSYSSYMTSDESGGINGIVVCPSQITYKSILRDNKIGCLTAIYDTSMIGKVYLPLIRKRQDWGLMIKVLKKCKVAYGLKEPLAIYRLVTNSISRDKQSLIKYNIGLYQEVLGWSWLRAVLQFCFVFTPTFILKKLIHKLYNS